MKSFLRYPIFQLKNHSGGRKGTWGGAGMFRGKTGGGGEGFPKSKTGGGGFTTWRILLGAAATTGFVIFCTDTCPYSGNDALPSLFFKHALLFTVPQCPMRPLSKVVN